MKKLTLLLLLTGCTFPPPFNKPLIVVGVAEQSDGCVYTAKIDNSHNNYKFKDECGKFNIGDTLKVVNANTK